MGTPASPKFSPGAPLWQSRRWRALRHGGTLLLFATLAIVITWPLARRPTDRLVIGAETTRTVPLFNAWTLWWNADRLRHRGEHYWDAPIFFPVKNTFAMSEPQPTTMIVAPLFWASDSRALPYNVYLWLSLVLNGWFASALLRSLGLRPAVALGGGVAMLLLPIVHWQIGIVQLVPVWGILWTWMAFLKIARLPDAETRPVDVLLRGGELGLAFAVAFLTCVHHGLFLGLLMGLSGVALGRAWLRPRVWAMLVIAVALAGLLVGPTVYHLHEMASTHRFARSLETVSQLSARVADYTAARGHSPVPGWLDVARPGWWMSPGWLKWVLAVVGLLGGLWQRDRRRASLFLGINAVVALALSQGPFLQIFSWQPWGMISEHVPGFAQVRNVYRFGYFVQIAVVLLAAIGVDAIWSRLAGGGRMGASARVAVAAVALLAVCDPWPPQPVLGVLPDAARHQGWIEFLRGHAAEGEGALCLPMAGGGKVHDFELTAEWMLLGSYHGVPLANGYSGFFPSQYFALQEAIIGEGLKIGTVRQMYADGIRWIVIDRRRFDLPWQDAWRLGPLRAERLYHETVGIDVYRLRMQEEEGP